MRILIYFICAGLLLACNSTKEYTAAELTHLETAVNAPQFTFTAQWANPLDQDATQVLNALRPAGGIVAGNRVRIDSGVYQLKVAEDQVEIDLPYFGTRQISSGNYPTDSGIQAKGPYKDFKIRNSKKPNLRNLSLQISDTTESYNISIQLFAGGTASITVNSSHRQSISYNGTWE